VETDGPSDRAFAHAAQDPKGQRDGSLQGALLGENKGPAVGLFQEIIQ
jgi:hypothetical protein